MIKPIILPSTFAFSAATIVQDDPDQWSMENLMAAVEKMKEVFGGESERRMLTAPDPFLMFRLIPPKPIEPPNPDDFKIFFRSRYDFSPKLIEPRIIHTGWIEDVMRDIDDLCRELGIDFEEFMRDRSDDTELECSAEIDTEMES